MGQRHLGRRGLLTAAGALAAASTFSATAVPALAAAGRAGRSEQVFVDGLVTGLPAPFNELVVRITATAELGGTGFGTDIDVTTPGTACNFNITSATKQGDVVTLEGRVFRAASADNAPSAPGAADGLGVRIVADSAGGDLASLTLTFTRPQTRPAFFGTTRTITATGFGVLEN